MNKFEHMWWRLKRGTQRHIRYAYFRFLLRKPTLTLDYLSPASLRIVRRGELVEYIRIADGVWGVAYVAYTGNISDGRDIGVACEDIQMGCSGMIWQASTGRKM